MAMISPNIAL